LIQGNLSATEKDAWYYTDFPNKDFQLLSSQLQNDGTLVLQFSEVPGFTDGWSARMLIMADSIIKTAMQFPGVKKVQFNPPTLFQP
jgi:spore germination protein GerM